MSDALTAYRKACIEYGKTRHHSPEEVGAFDHMMAAQRNLRQEMQRQHEWRHIDATAKNGNSILACDAEGNMRIVWWEGGRWWGSEGNYMPYRFVYWMPLPLPPDGAG